MVRPAWWPVEAITIRSVAKETKWAKPPMQRYRTAGGYGQPHAMTSLACMP
jgi:hypothetical protein